MNEKILYAYLVGNYSYPDYKSPYKYAITCKFNPSSGWEFSWKEKTQFGEEAKSAYSSMSNFSDAVNDALISSKKFPALYEYGSGWYLSDNPDMPNSVDWKKLTELKEMQKAASNKNYEDIEKNQRQRNLYIGVAVVAIGAFLFLRK